MEEIRKNEPGWTEALGEHASNPPTPRTSGDTITVYRECEVCDGTGTVTPPNPDHEQVICPSCSGTGRSTEVEEEWKVSSLEARIKAQFEQWVRRNARRGIAEVEATDGTAEANAMRSTYIADFGAGYYNWDGKHVRSAFGDIPGLAHLLYLLMKRCQPNMTEEKALDVFERAPRECSMAIKWAREGNSRSTGKSKPTKTS